MSAKDYQAQLVRFWTQRCKDLLQDRNNLSPEDLEYVVTKLDKIKDEKLKCLVVELIGWGDDERAELETFCAIALELMKTSSPSRLREAARTVEIRSLVRKPEVDDESKTNMPRKSWIHAHEYGINYDINRLIFGEESDIRWVSVIGYEDMDSILALGKNSKIIGDK